MAKGTQIIVTAEPRGVREEGFISGTPKPGTVVQIKEETADVGGRFTWEVYDADADGNQRMIAVLLPKDLEGGLETAAYVNGDRCFVYFPLPGETLNMLYKAVAGTSDNFKIGDILMVDDSSGKLIHTTGSPESEPFVCLETVSAISSDTLTWSMFTGY